MKPRAGLAVLLFLFLSNIASSEENEMVAYQPDVVGVGRMFLVALHVPQDMPEIARTQAEDSRLVRSDMRSFSEDGTIDSYHHAS